MSTFFKVSMVVGVALLSLALLVWAKFRPRITFQRGTQRIGRTRVFDGAVNVTTRGDMESFSGYICYIRRARQKSEQLPDVAL